MAYIKTVYVDRNVEFPRRYLDELSNQKTFTPDPGIVTEAGTDLTAIRLNNIEQGIFDSYYQSGATPPTSGTATYTWSGNKITQSNEFEGGLLFRKTTYTYSGDDISSINFKIYNTSGTVIRDWTISFTIVSGKVTNTSTTVSV